MLIWKRVAPPTPRCSSYRKRSHRVTLDRQLYLYWYKQNLALNVSYANKNPTNQLTNQPNNKNDFIECTYKIEMSWLVKLQICVFILFFSFLNRLIGQVGRVFANGLGDLGSIPGRVLPKTLKMVLGTSLLNTQQCKVRIEGKVEQSRERSSALSYTSV